MGRAALALVFFVAAVAGCAPAAGGAGGGDAEAPANTAGSLEVQVKDNTNQPVNPDSVRFIPTDPEVVVPDIGVQTSKRGVLRHDSLPAGDYTVELKAAGYRPSETKVSIPELGSESINVTLEPLD